MPPTPARSLWWQLGCLIQNPAANAQSFQAGFDVLPVQLQRAVLEREYLGDRQSISAGKDSNRGKNGRDASARRLHAPCAYPHQVLTAVAGNSRDVGRLHIVFPQEALQRRERRQENWVEVEALSPNSLSCHVRRRLHSTWRASLVCRSVTTLQDQARPAVPQTIASDAGTPRNTCSPVPSCLGDFSCDE
jgi:hypothetical protein